MWLSSACGAEANDRSSVLYISNNMDKSLLRIGVVKLLMLSQVRSLVLTYQPGSCMLLFHLPIHCQNCPVSEPPSVFHSFFSAKEKTDTRKDLRVCLVDCRNLKLSVQKKISYTNYCFCHQIKHTLEILSLLHWLTPLLTLTTHSTARFRACWTSSRAGTMAILGMERVTLTLKIACWPLLLPRLGESLSATGWEKSSSDTRWCNSKIDLLAQ